ncbi:MAG: MFS transporter, partial [Prevotella sp.]|nr:MFS transporter [Prevotella sp.]
MKRRNPWAWIPTLYLAEGVPYVAVMTIALILYKRLGLSNTDATLYTSWLYLPWVIKPLWSPFVDILKSKRWWILSMQLLIGAALGGVAFTIPVSWWLQGSLCFFWLMAFASATHDIAADGFYMLGLDEHEQAYFVGIRSTFYRIATLFSSGLLIALAGALQVITRNIRYSWSLVFYLMAGVFIAFWLYHSWALPRPREDGEQERKSVSEILTEFRQTVVTFIQKPQVWVALCFMLFYRMPEGLLAKVADLFLVDAQHNGGLGLSDSEFGLVKGTVGIIGLTLGGILGGICASRDGLRRWLWPMVLAITLPDLVYVYLSYALP